MVFYDTDMEQETRQDNHQEEAVCMHALYICCETIILFFVFFWGGGYDIDFMI